MLFLQRLQHLPESVLGHLPSLPGLCHICRRWQSAMICRDCLSRWRQPLRRCVRCAIDLPSHHAEETCQACEDQSPEVDRTIAALHYAPPWNDLLAHLKFRETSALARPLGQLLAEAVADRQGSTSLVIPIPLSTQRLRERGYNQSWLLAREVAKRRQLPCRHDVLLRHTHTPRLMTLSAEERLRHIREAYAISPDMKRQIRGHDIALVDDVMTTGATLNAAAQILLEAGASSVSAWVLARTPAPSSLRPKRAQ